MLLYLCTNPDHIEVYFDVDILEYDEDDDIVRNWCRSDLTSDYRIPAGDEDILLIQQRNKELCRHWQRQQIKGRKNCFVKVELPILEREFELAEQQKGVPDQTTILKDV